MNSLKDLTYFCTADEKREIERMALEANERRVRELESKALRAKLLLERAKAATSLRFQLSLIADVAAWMEENDGR